MELKNAVAVCLISLCSATLVVLIARSLDVRAASELKPQLQQIAKALRAIRTSGQTIAPSGGAPTSVQDGLVVYYFHGDTRCPTCRSIESQAHQTVQADFATEVDRGEIVWEVLNYEKPAGEALEKKFEVVQPVVVLARRRDGQTAEWKRLDRVWALIGDKPAFRQYLRGEIAAMLRGDAPPSKDTPADRGPDKKPADLPAPPDTSSLPLPP